MLIEIVTLFVVSTFAVFTYQYIRHIINLSNFPHGPFPLPIIGNLHLLSHKPYEDLNKLAKSYGDVFSMSFGMTRLVVVNSAKAGKEGLVTKSNHFAGRPTNIYTISLLSRGNASFAFGDYSPMWKTLRKIAHSTLKVYGKNYEKLEKWITEESEQLHQILLKAQGKALDPTYEIGCSVMNIISQKTLGRRYQRTDQEFKELIRSQDLLIAGIGSSDAVAFLPWLRIFPLRGLAKLKKGIAFRDYYFRKQVKEHQLNFDSNNIKDLVDEVIKLSRQEECLYNYFKENDIVEMFIIDMFTGGNETTITALRWFIVYMMHWPEYQDKVYDEIINTVGTDGYPTYKERDRLPLFQACIQETLRMGNIAVLGLPRRTTQDTSLNNVNIPKDTQIMFNFWNYHMNEKYWENPNIYNPYRWLDENHQYFEQNKYASFIPFSAGIRNCPGEPLARLELFLFMSRIMRDFILQKDELNELPPLEGKLGITLSPESFRVKFIPRDKSIIHPKYLS